MKRISELEVSCPEGVVLKKIDFNQEELDNVVKLKCSGKATAIVLLDGTKQDEIKDEIPWKKHKKYINKIEVYALNKAPFKILFGFGGYPYEERSTSIKTNLGFTGQCTLEVTDSKLLLTNFPSVDVLSEDVATSTFRSGVCDVIKSAIGDELCHLRKSEVEPTLMEIREKGKDSRSEGLNTLLRKFFSARGLSMRDFTIKVNFPSDFLEKFQDYADREADAKQYKKEMDIINKAK